ncbi:MAG TPA: TonB-dependent receptor [Caulobacteraceae bacterium]|jgi:outer membrane receptor protein involved in Fe transport|nr:TonB-dependent receptor [Caulobacteraceae bacterium]
MTRIAMLLGMTAAGALLHAEPALAAPATTAAGAADQAPQPGASGDVDAVVVTGSRIVRDGYEAPTPVTVLTVADLLATTPTNIADALNKLPALSPQFTPQANTGAAAPAGNFLNLRGLGQNRTLVMLDGVRVPATNTTGTVDVNTLPQALVQRVDIVTGGASAIYGSDAVGGVVNYILNTKFNGFKGSVQGGISTYGDAPSGKVSLAFGTKLLDRGHFEASYEHNQSAGLDQSDRDYTRLTPGYAGAGTDANPFILYNNLRMSTTTLGGFISAPTGATPAQTAALATAIGNQQFVGAGTLAVFNNGGATGTPGLQIGGDGAYVSDGQLVKPVKTDNLFARFDYDVGHGITAYAQLAYGLSQTNYLIPPAAQAVTVISGNPYLPANVQAALTAASAPGRPATFVLTSLPQNLYDMRLTHQWDADLSTTFGLKGRAFDDAFSWNAAYTHGKGHTHVENDNNINTSRFYAALDAVKDPSGNIVCAVSLTSSASLYPGCVPFNFIGYGNESPASLAYVMQNTAYDIINKIDELSGSLSGTAFNDWAGPVSVSVNGEARWVSLTETTDASPNTPPQLTGLRQTWVAAGRNALGPSLPFVGATTAAQQGSNSVWEVGGETVVPLLKDLPLAKNLEFSGALRYTEYSSSGPATTWKVGLSYQPIDDLRLRATESRDIRAPTLFDLYQAQTTSTATGTDPTTNKTYAVNQYSGGNPNVKPEVATTKTLGVVYSPSWLPRFRMSLDYYSINIVNGISNSIPAIGATGINVALQGCAAGIAIYCQAVPKDAAGNLLQINAFPINLAQQYTRGWDLEASYGFDMSDIRAKWVGHTDLRLLATYSPTNLTIAAPGQPAAASALSAPLVPRVTGNVNYSLGAFRASWQIGFTASHRIALPSLTPVIYAVPFASSVVTHDLNLSYSFKAEKKRSLEAFLTINNLFNHAPTLIPPAPTTTPGSQAPTSGGPSPLGRYFTAGLRFTY